MYPITTHYTKTATVERMAITTGNKQELTEVFADIPCHVQPLDDSFSEDIEGAFGKGFLMFCDVMDIRQGDRVTIDNNEYRVMGLEKYNFLKRNKHMEITIRVFKN